MYNYTGQGQEEDQVNPYKKNPYNSKLGFAASNVLLPLMGLAEVIGTKGNSKGEFALGLANNFQNKAKEYDQKALSWDEMQQKNREKALERQLLGKREEYEKEDRDWTREQRQGQRDAILKDKEYQSKLAEIDQEQLSDVEKNNKAYQLGLQYGKVNPKFMQEKTGKDLTGLPDEILAMPEGKEKQAAYQKWYMQTYPKDYYEMINKPKSTLADDIAKAIAITKATENVKREIGAPLKQEQIDNLNNLRSSVNDVKNIANVLNPKWASPFMGQKIQDVMSKFDKERAAFQTAQSQFTNTLLKLRSGAAVTPQEFERLLKEVGDLNASPEAYYSKLNKMSEILSDKYNNAIESYQNSNVDIGDWKPIEPQTYTFGNNNKNQQKNNNTKLPSGKLPSGKRFTIVEVK